MKKSLVFVMLAAGVLGTVATAHADPRTRLMAANCAFCHGTEGKARAAFPGLAGMDPGYFVAQMKAFKDGSRPATVMQKHALGYTDAEFEAMAKYFAAIK